MRDIPAKDSNEPIRTKLIGRAPIFPDRVRSIGGQGFAFVPNRFLREGFLASLSPDEQRLYFFLVLAGDRSGMSFYHYDSICSLLELTIDAYLEARNGLIDKDLVAYDGTRFQVLTLPAVPSPGPKRSPSREDPGAPASANEIRRELLEAFRR